MAFNIRIPFVIATHGKKFTSTAGLKNKSKAFAYGMVGTTLYWHDGSAVKSLGSYTPVSATGATLSLTQALHSNRVVVANRAAGMTVTLPTATGTGDKYRVVIGTTLTSGSFVLAVADATDYMRGRALFQNDTDGSASNFETANTGTLATESDTITMNRTTTGIGTIGDEVYCEDIATDIWLVRVEAQANGTEATPFSAAV